MVAPDESSVARLTQRLEVANYWEINGFRRLGASDRHFRNEQCRAVDAAANTEVIGRLKGREHLLEVGGNGDLRHRRADLAIADQEAGGAAGIVAGHAIDALPDQLGDQDAIFHAGNHFIGAKVAWRKIKIGRPCAWRARDPADGMAGWPDAKLTGGRAFRQPGIEHSVTDQFPRRYRKSFAVEGAAAQASLAKRLVVDGDPGSENLGFQGIHEEAGLAGH